ncbi:MAG: hypothetical protein ACRC32_16340, partial [Chroococcidiopsis sp.]
MQVVIYTDSIGIGGAEISLSHLVASVSDRIEVTVIGTSELVVEAIARQRPQIAKIVLPKTPIHSLLAHFTALLQLRPDVVHVNLCTPWVGAMGLAAALILPGARVVRVDQLPLRTTDLLTWWRTRVLDRATGKCGFVKARSSRRLRKTCIVLCVVIPKLINTAKQANVVSVT